MPKVVYSRNAAGVVFTQFVKTIDPKSLPVICDRVLIEGKAGVAVLGHNAVRPETAGAVATVVPDEKFEWLSQHPVFKSMVEKNHLLVVDERTTNPEKLKAKAEKHVGDLNKDLSAPLNNKDFETGDDRVGSQVMTPPVARKPKNDVSYV